MIKPGDAILLAATKLRVRRIRLIVTVVISALLFAGLVLLGSLTEGITRSLRDFGREGYGNRFLVQAYPLAYNPSDAEKQLVDRLKPIQTDIVARKKAAAKKLNVPYDEKDDQTLPLVTLPGFNGGESQTIPNPGSVITAQLLAKINGGINGTKFSQFTALAKQAGAINTYRGTMPGNGYGYGEQPPQLNVLVDGKEPAPRSRDNNQPPDTTGLASISTLGWRMSDDELLKPFLLPGQNLSTGQDGSVPIIAPFSAAEQVVGLKPLPQTATPKQKLARLDQVRAAVAGKSAQLCSRNTASAEDVAMARQQQSDLAANAKNKQYVKPSLIYKPPAVACGPVSVQADTRTAEEKKQTANQDAFDKQFGNYQEPKSGIVSLRIVGISPDVDYGAGFDVSSVLTTLFSSSLGTGWVSPIGPVQNNPVALAAHGAKLTDEADQRTSYFAEFPTLAAMQSFMKSQTCQAGESISTPTGPVFINGGGDQIRSCVNQGKVFGVSTYGNSAGAIEEFRSGIWSVTKYVILVIVVLAALVLMGNLGKVIADSRRETAVYRALGAKRFDIAQIYLTYTVMICLLIMACATVIGSCVAFWLHGRFSPGASVTAVLAYNAQDTDKQFSLYGFNPLYLGAILGLILVAGLLSALIPLLANTRRNPIRDMRDDT